MRERDPIFWAATAIFVLSLVLAGTVHEVALLLMAFAYLLRPTLHALGLARRYADERQLTDQYRSGNIAFTVIVAGLIILAADRQLRDEPADAYFALLCVGIAAKALANRLLGKDWRPTGIIIVLSVAALMTLFGLIEEGLTFPGLMHSIPGLILAAIGVTGFRYPRVAGVLTAAAAAFAIYFFKLYLLRQVPTFLLIAVPLIIASACLTFGRDPEASEADAPV
jgi:hypothetical protein